MGVANQTVAEEVAEERAPVAHHPQHLAPCTHQPRIYQRLHGAPPRFILRLPRPGIPLCRITAPGHHRTEHLVVPFLLLLLVIGLLLHLLINPTLVRGAALAGDTACHCSLPALFVHVRQCALLVHVRLVLAALDARLCLQHVVHPKRIHRSTTLLQTRRHHPCHQSLVAQRTAGKQQRLKAWWRVLVPCLHALRCLAASACVLLRLLTYTASFASDTQRRDHWRGWRGCGRGCRRAAFQRSLCRTRRHGGRSNPNARIVATHIRCPCLAQPSLCSSSVMRLAGHLERCCCVLSTLLAYGLHTGARDAPVLMRARHVAAIIVPWGMTGGAGPVARRFHYQRLSRCAGRQATESTVLVLV